MPYDMLDGGLTLNDDLEASIEANDSSSPSSSRPICVYHVASVFGPTLPTQFDPRRTTFDRRKTSCGRSMSSAGATLAPDAGLFPLASFLSFAARACFCAFVASYCCRTA
jgi:hypothetical protein